MIKKRGEGLRNGVEVQKYCRERGRGTKRVGEEGREGRKQGRGQLGGKRESTQLIGFQLLPLEAFIDSFGSLPLFVYLAAKEDEGALYVQSREEK